jgi:hypothetical protein
MAFEKCAHHGVVGFRIVEIGQVSCGRNRRAFGAGRLLGQNVRRLRAARKIVIPCDDEHRYLAPSSGAADAKSRSSVGSPRSFPG